MLLAVLKIKKSGWQMFAVVSGGQLQNKQNYMTIKETLQLVYS